MKTLTKQFISVQNKRYEYSLQVLKDGVTHVVCGFANIDQDFLNEDVPDFLQDLSSLILSEKKYREGRENVIRFQVSEKEKRIIEKRALKKGFRSVSGFVQDIILK